MVIFAGQQGPCTLGGECIHGIGTTLVLNFGGGFTSVCFIAMLYLLLYYIDTTHIVVYIKYYIIKN